MIRRSGDFANGSACEACLRIQIGAALRVSAAPYRNVCSFETFGTDWKHDQNAG